MAQDNVDSKIAVNKTVDDKSFVVIISNENYKHEESVPFARNDGEVFRVYCEKSLGIPSDHIKFAPDATLNEMSYELDWLAEALNAYDGEARAILYYTGHGMPDEGSKEAYLLPVDGYSKSTASALSTRKLYDKLGEMRTASVMVFLDACFSGAKRDGKMLASSRGVAVKPKASTVGANTVVFSAAKGDETAYPYKSMQHGLFTYYVLDKLQKTGGYVTLGELSDYVTQQVKRKSITENGKSQTPSVIAASGNSDWRKWLMASTAAKKYEERKQQNNSAPKQDTTPLLGQNQQNNAAPVVPTTPKQPTTPTTPIQQQTQPVQNNPNTEPYVPMVPNNNPSPATTTLIKKGQKAMKAMDYETARQCFVQAAGQGSSEAEYQLGLLYYNKNYDGYDRDMATVHFLKAANTNHVEAMYQAGMIHRGIDNTEARKWLQRAADKGHEGAKRQLSHM
jgi:hypothetical protein